MQDIEWWVDLRRKQWKFCEARMLHFTSTVQHVLRKTMEEALQEKRSTVTGGETIETIEYVNDEEELQGTMSNRSRIGEKFVMIIFTEKGKVMQIGKEDRVLAFTLGEKALGKVKPFSYLGSLTTWKGNCK